LATGRLLLIFPLSYSIADMIHNRRCAAFDPLPRPRVLLVRACASRARTPVASLRLLRFAGSLPACGRAGCLAMRRPSKSAANCLIALAPRSWKA
jgi:hypothetical protein